MYNQLVEKAAAATDETVKAALEAAAEKMVVKAEDVTAESFEPDTYYTMTMEYNEETTTQEPVYTLATEFVEGVVYYHKVEGILTLHTDFEIPKLIN